jgi:hypothetical protein
MTSNSFTDVKIWIFFEWIGITVLIGIIPSVIFSFLLKLSKNYHEFIALLIGVIAFTGGIAFHFNHSSLVTGFLGGVVIANMCRKRIDAIKILKGAERSIYIIILLILGAGLKDPYGFEIVIFVVYFVFRAIGKMGGNYLGLKIFPASFKTPITIGIALLSEGGISFAILINFYILFPQYSKIVLPVGIISALISELISPKLILMQFREKELRKKSGENKNDNK